jgi:hypothetical protein
MSVVRKSKSTSPESADAPKRDVSASLPFAIIGKPWSAKLKKADAPSDDTIVYRLTGGPSWLSFDPATRTLSVASA